MPPLESINHPLVQQFIQDHKLEDVHDLLLRHKEVHGVPIRYIVDQISGLRKAKEKLPLWYHTKGIVFPPSINLEQSSSEATAEIKNEILSAESFPKNSVLDLTGGLGVDSFFLSRLFNHADYVEPNNELLELAAHNHHVLGASNIRHHHTDAKSFLTTSAAVDLIYADPSRRTEGKAKVFRLSDCAPNVAELLSEIFTHAPHFLLKVSPLLDIQQGLRELHHVKRVYVLSIDNECKELLFFCSKGFDKEPEVVAINSHQKGVDRFSFYFSEEGNSKASLHDPLTYLYEPNASILKAGAFNLVALKYNVLKIHTNTHFYTSNDLVADFPGRVFKTVSPVKSDPHSIAQLFPEGKGNVIVRNYPLSPDELRKKIRLKDGGSQYLLAFSGKLSKFLIAAERIK